MCSSSDSRIDSNSSRGDEVPNRLAVPDGSLELDVCRHLELEIALETFLHTLADEQLAQVLQIGQTVEKQNALDEAIGMLHLVDRLILLVLLQAHQAPVAEHAGVQKILVDRRELVLQHGVQVLQYLGIALHARDSSGIIVRRLDLGGMCGGAQR